MSDTLLAALVGATAQLLVFTNEKSTLENTYARKETSRVTTAHIKQFNSDFAGLLTGVYRFQLYGNLEGEFIRLAGTLTAHGAERNEVEAALKAWIMALQTIIKHPESDELTESPRG